MAGYDNEILVRLEVALELCPVCEQNRLSDFVTISHQRYLRCVACEAKIMAPECRLSMDEERAIYELHKNDAGDPGYRRFLSRLSEPLLGQLTSGMVGLDFGCGPGPVLAGMLREAGMVVRVYDPFFYPQTEVLHCQYDFITCTEVLEHLYHPMAVFRQLNRLLKPGGWLGVMTCFQTDDARFANWHYRRDPTHVVFYREFTLASVARIMGWKFTVPLKDVALFQKLPGAPSGSAE
jgi:2-polyprenyl-3-methyl-5-hydroxy-6-metoxy-1,4-benzoquinol methylase